MRENDVSFRAVHFRNYKTFKDFRLSLRSFNVLVGRNNSGKSTILGAFRILAEGIRRARARNPMAVSAPCEEASWGYQVSLAEVPIATENVFFNYDDSEPSVVTFELSNGHSLILLFREAGVCYLIPKSERRGIRSASQFKAEFPVDVAFVPILGPVEHDEPLYKQEAARLALLTHRASRNFRNIWYHSPDQFDDFRRLINETWPGMDINRPEIDTSHGNPMLRIFCPEDRIARELYWSGFGFQVWCQMLTFVMRAKQASILLIDEPDIYLHPDLQRRLLGVLKSSPFNTSPLALS